MNDEYPCIILDDSTTWEITEICTLCRVDMKVIHEMVSEGVLVPEGASPDT